MALSAAKDGRAVFPLAGKTPTTGATPHGYKDASTERSRIAGMFNAAGPTATGYGIATGKVSGIVVVDIDNAEAGAEADRMGLVSDYTVSTGRGEHRYFALPSEAGVEVRSRDLAPDLELKAEGCYVVGPGSLHPSGGGYAVVKDGEPSPLPASLEIITASFATKPEGKPGPEIVASLVSVDVGGPPIVEGERNHSLARIAGRLHDSTRTLDELTAELLAINQARCSPPLDSQEVEGIATSIDGKPPCNPRPEITPRVVAAVDYLASVERPVKGMGGATHWSIYRAGLELLRRYGREHPDGLELSVDVRTWAQMAGTGRSTVSRHIKRSPLLRQIKRGSGRRSSTVLFSVPWGQAKGHKVGHSSTRVVSKKNTTPASVPPSALLRTLERLRWGPGRIGKSRAAILHALVECGEAGELSRATIAATLGRKPESLRAPLRWLVEAGLLERTRHGHYALPADFARRVEDARALGREPEADRLQIARHDRERDSYRNRRHEKPQRAPEEGETRQHRESYPERRRAATERAIAALFRDRPEYRARRVGQITARLVHYIGPDYPRGPDGAPRDAEVEVILDGHAA